MHIARHFAQLFCLCGIHRKRFFAQHMFASACRRQRGRHMLVVGQRVVDGLDFGVGKQFFIRAVGFGNAQGVGKPPRFLK